MGCDDFREEDFLMEEDWNEVIAGNQLDRFVSVEEMRDMICEEMHELNRGLVYSHLLKMGSVFRSCDLFSLMLYFDNLYMLDEG